MSSLIPASWLKVRRLTPAVKAYAHALETASPTLLSWVKRNRQDVASTFLLLYLENGTATLQEVEQSLRPTLAVASLPDHVDRLTPVSYQDAPRPLDGRTYLSRWAYASQAQRAIVRDKARRDLDLETLPARHRIRLATSILCPRGRFSRWMRQRYLSRWMHAAGV